MTLSAEPGPTSRTAGERLISQRRVRRGIVALFAVALVWLAVMGALPVGAQSPEPSVAPSPAATSAPPTASASPILSSSPAPTAAPASLPGGANPAVPQPPCPLPTPTPVPPATPAPSLAAGETAPPATPAPTPPPHALCPAVPSGNPVDLLAYLFNPIFQTMFLVMTAFYALLGDIGIAIILLTLIIKTALIPLFRAQIVSQRRMQMLQPEIKSIQLKFKGNRNKISEETMRLYRERGVSVGSGCLPAFLQLFLLLPIYSVISQGLAAPDISSALQFLGQPVLQDFQCQLPGTLQPCIDPNIWWLGNLNASVPEILFRLPVIGFGVSLLAIIAAALQLVQTRMMSPATTDPQAAAQQRIFLILPLFSIIYGSFLPAGLFLYWIVFTAYSIVQQYLIVGWGSLFPLFGWTPGFAQDHTPRFPIAPPVAKPGATSGDSRQNEEPSRSPADRAAGTIKPARQRGRTSRRGRRR
jgi:YidC/Oxa1 family membrane protein insertase